MVVVSKLTGDRPINLKTFILVFLSYYCKFISYEETRIPISDFEFPVKPCIYHRWPEYSKSGIEVGQGINVGSGEFGKKNKHRALN